MPLNYLEGFNGYVQTDGYNGYDALGRRAGIVMLGCWAHARRKFYDVIQAASAQVAKRRLAAEDALEFIKRLYQIEKEARLKELPAPAICELRQQQAKPILEEFKKWLDEKAPLTPPGGLLGKAIGYTLNHACGVVAADRLSSGWPLEAG